MDVQGGFAMGKARDTAATVLQLLFTPRLHKGGQHDKETFLSLILVLMGSIQD